MNAVLYLRREDGCTRHPAGFFTERSFNQAGPRVPYVWPDLHYV